MSWRPMPVRHRVALAFMVLGLLLSTLFSIATVWTADDYETVLVEEILRSQADDYAARLRTNPDALLPRTRRLSAYLEREGGDHDVPPEYAALLPGLHEADDVATSGIHIGVFDIDAGRLYFVADLRDIEAFEVRLFRTVLVVIVLGTSLSTMLGWWIGGCSLAPLRRLADSVDSLPSHPQGTALARTVSKDELGRLANAIDAYQLRLLNADAQERAFFADASHELRTPISVVRGVAEVLLDEPGADAQTQRRLQRLDRGVQELTDLMDVLFGLARRLSLRTENVDAHRLLCDAASGLTAYPTGFQVQVDVVASGTLHLARQEFSLLLRAILRRLVPPETSGLLRLVLHGCLIDLSFRSASDGALQGKSGPALWDDRGLALTLTGRLATRLGCCFESIDDRDAQDMLRLRLPDRVFNPRLGI